MTEFNQRIQADIYKIDPDKHNGSTENTIETIVQNHRGQDYIYIPLKTEVSNLEGFNVRLYVNDIVESPPEWTLFLSEISTEEGAEAIANLQRKYPSFLLFVYSDTRIYVVSKGAGRFVIINYIQESFGVEILERLLDKDESDLRGLRERGVLGNVLAADKYFKPDHKFADEQSFGKFYKSVDALVPKEVLREKLGVDTDRTNLIVSGENTLKISTQLNITDLIGRVQKVDRLLRQRKTVNLNKFKKLTSKKLRESIEGRSLETALQEKLIEKVWNEYDAGVFSEVYHPEIFEYLQSNSVEFHYEGNSVEYGWSQRLTLNLIFEGLDVNPENKEDFIEIVLGTDTQLIFEEEDYPGFPTSLRNWLLGEVELGDKKYFKFDGEWFIYENAFIEEINNRVQRLLDKIGVQENLPVWTTADTEGIYNQSFRGNSETIVCDKALYGGIEICDFLKFENNKLRMYHVKNGWGQSVRVVYNQILNGARFLAEIQNNSGRRYSDKLRGYYNSIERHHYRNGVPIPVTFEQFKRILNRKQVTFVLVYGSTSTNDRDTQITSSTSNIAKLSIVQCENELRSFYDFGFEITKVDRR